MKAADFFTAEQKKQITEAIKLAELNTSGEIRVHFESKCKIDVLERAAQVFDILQMQKTELRNGVLFYLAIENQQFAILGDAGINQKVSENFWEQIKETMLTHFKTGDFAGGLEQGILMAGEQLKAHFNYQSDDKNELSDEISFG